MDTIRNAHVGLLAGAGLGAVLLCASVLHCGSDGEASAGSGGAGSGQDASLDGAAGTKTEAGGGSAGAAGSSGSAGASGQAGTSGAGGAAGAGGPVACPVFDDATSGGEVESGAIDEASGLVASRSQPGVLWVHNDSGDGPRVFAMRTDGTDLGHYTIQGVWATDWEDMALGPGPLPSTDYLYLGDFGDNNEQRDGVVVYRAPEPNVDPTSGPVTGDLLDVEELRLTYPGGSAHNAETLLADPVSGDLFIVTKKSSGLSDVYRSAAPQDPAATRELAWVASLAFGQAPLDGSPLTTAGDVSFDGALVAIRTYNRAYVWRRAPGASLWSAFGGEPCPLPLHAEPQGETIAFSGNATAYYTVSEGAHQPIYEFARLP